jgi:hypothetical protein
MDFPVEECGNLNLPRKAKLIAQKLLARYHILNFVGNIELFRTKFDLK